MRPAPVPPQLLSGPFRCADAKALGVSDRTLRGDRFRAPFPGVRVAAALEDTARLRASAALLALPDGSVLSCETAAELWRLPLPSQWSPAALSRPPLVHANVPGVGSRPRIDGIRVHMRPAPSVLVQGLPVSPPADMFAQLGDELSLLALVTVGDALVKKNWISLDGLRAAGAATRSCRGAQVVRRAAEFVRAQVDSPMETAIRLLVVLAGLPSPEPGYRVIVDGHVIGWVDLALPAYRVVIEYDGDLHRTLKKKWRSDVSTRDDLRELGWTVIVLTWDDYAVTPTRTVGRIARALARAGCPVVPPDWRAGHVHHDQLSDEWRAAFPGRGRQAWDWADAPSGSAH